MSQIILIYIEEIHSPMLSIELIKLLEYQRFLHDIWGKYIFYYTCNICIWCKNMLKNIILKKMKHNIIL